MFKLGDTLVGFALRIVYGTVVTPAMKSKWDADEDGNCKLCETIVERFNIFYLGVLHHYNKADTDGDMIRSSNKFMNKCHTI